MSALGMPNLSGSDGTTSQFGVGDVYQGGLGNVYVYCKNTAVAISAYAILSGANPGVVAGATTTTATALGTAGGFACVPQFDVGASEYFWAVVESPTGLAWDGTTTIKVLAANVTAGNLLYSTATTGVLDDDSAGSTIALVGITLVTTVTTQAATKFTTFRRMGWLK